MGTFFGVPIIRTVVVGVHILYWGSPILGNYHMDFDHAEPNLLGVAA